MTRRLLLPVAFIAALAIVVLVVGPLVGSTLIGRIQTREGGWNEATLPDADGAAIYALAPIDGKILAFGAGVWTTTDGLAWERVATQEQVGHPGDYAGSVAHVRGVTIISLDPLIRISGDLRAWTDVDIDPNAKVVVKQIVAGGPGFLAFGSRAGI